MWARDESTRVTPREFFQAIEENDGVRFERGLTYLLREIRAHGKHPLVSAARHDQSGATLEQLVADYLGWVLEKGLVRALLIQNWRGACVDFERHLRRTRRRDPSIERQAGLYSELLYEKVVRVLREEPTFERIPSRPAKHRLLDVPEGNGMGDDDAIAHQLPRLVPILASKAERAPELVARRALSGQLTRALELGGNQPRTARSLKDVVWETLDPTPADHLHARAKPEAESGGGHADSLPPEASGRQPSPEDLHEMRSWEERIDLAAHAFLRALPPRRVRAASLRWGADDEPRTLEQVRRALGVSRGTADNECKSFLSDFATFATREDLSSHQTAQLFDVILEMLRAGDFHAEEETEP